MRIDSDDRKTQPQGLVESYWRSVRQDLFGTPLLLRELARDRASALAPPVFRRSIDEGDMPQWDLLAKRAGGWPHRAAGEIRMWRYDRSGERSEKVIVEAFKHLITESKSTMTVDIRDIECLVFSKTDLYKFATLDEMATTACPDWIKNVSREQLHALLAKAPPASTEGWLSLVAWDDRLTLIAYDGSHHFAAARYLAGQLNEPVPMTMELTKRSINAQALDELEQSYDAFVLLDRPDFNHALTEAFKAASVPHGRKELRLSRALGDRNYQLILLPRESKRAMRSAAVLHAAGALTLPRLLRIQQLQANDHLSISEVFQGQDPDDHAPGVRWQA
ncbi:DUF6685 family protein [Xanthomonas citri]|uniref:DUF6685 family protein n=1 Tax=Xanthomonas citri TaxID=346 RepID=UPI000CCF49CC|nr:DUF6685 family protein [Xanthomonas citri]PNV26659.1 hypothetical protein xavtCFBP7764_22435 [Xanthomonas citri]